MSQISSNNTAVDQFTSQYDDPAFKARSQAMHDAVLRALHANPTPVGESGLGSDVELEQRQADLRLADCEARYAAGTLTDSELQYARRMRDFLRLSIRERVRHGAAEIHRAVRWLDLAHPSPELAELAGAVNEHRGRVIAAQQQALAAI